MSASSSSMTSFMVEFSSSQYSCCFEAHACLSDKKKREIFNVKRSFTKCKHCNVRDCAASGSDRWSGYNVLREKAGLRRPGSSPDLTQTDWVLDQERLRTFRARARARVFGNLEKAWKERGFTGLEKTSIVTDGFNKNPKHEVKMNINFDRSKRTSETNQEQDETLIRTEKIRMDAVEQERVLHPQLFRPRKNLGVLIRDLQAEFNASIKSKQCQNDDEQEVASRKISSPENHPITDERGSETLVQDGYETLDAMSGVHLQGNCMNYSPGTLKTGLCNQAVMAGQRTVCTEGNHSPSSSAHGYACPDQFLDKGSSAPKNEALQLNVDASEQRYDKGFMCNIRKEHDLKFEEPVVTVMGFQALQENEEKYSSRTRRQNEDCTSTVARKHVQCGQTRQVDCLDLEEAILRTQREKSEHLLKTLQQLREETRTVAASLNHLRTGCS
ncbi:hypothetical protein L7F22_031595 [Adiantum nelumboides]|nr:hypothetical protein [Adiantum nelumboides]